MTFVQATFLLGTFVHISNISALTDQILTKLLGPNFLGVFIFVDQNFLDKTFFIPSHPPPPHKLNMSNIFVVTITSLILTKLYKSAISQLLLIWFWPNFFDPFFIFVNKIFFWQNFISHQYLSCYWPDIDLSFFTQFFGGLNFCGQNFFWQNFF